MKIESLKIGDFVAQLVSSVKSAQVICKYWLRKYDRLPDALAVEGPGAGGHLGFTREQR